MSIGVAVVGYGYWGPNMLRNAVETEGIDAKAVCELREDRRAGAVDRYPHVEPCDDFRELLPREDIDALIVTTELDQHYEIAEAALKAGKHLIVGKPLCPTVEEAEHLCSIADRNDRVLLVDHTFLYTGAVRKIKELIDSGQIGDPLYFDSVRVNLGLVQEDHNVLWDLAPHDLSILLYLLDETPTAVSAIGACHVNHEQREPLETIGYLSLRLPGDTLAHIHVNWLSPVKVRKTLIAGTERMIVYNDLDPDEKVKLYDKGVEVTEAEDETAYEVLVQYRTGDILVPKIETEEALRTEMRHFRDCIRGEAEPVTPGKQGLDVVKILRAADRSLKEDGRFVTL